jgi:hypothetical protein
MRSFIGEESVDRYCAMCGEVILEENISGAIDWALGEEFGAVQCDASSNPIPPEYLFPSENANRRMPIGSLCI